MHTHPNRDKYINIIWKNVENGQNNPSFTLSDRSKFSNLNTTYDFNSILHYATSSPDGKQIIKATPEYKTFEQFMGQESRLSEGDVQRIKNMYECKWTYQ